MRMSDSVERIYLDHAATTPVRPEAVEAMLPWFDAGGYNPSSLHAEGRRARAALDDARDLVARLLGAQRKEILFVGSGSEADNLALIGMARTARSRGKHLVSCTFEHHAVLHALDALRDEGFEITLLPVDSDGRVDPERFAAALRPDTIIASIMLANNEVGTIQPIAQFAAIAHEHGVLFHTDAVQAPNAIALDVQALGVDALALSAHKFYGPKGVGVLFVHAGTPLEPLVHGGGQEFGRRSGTENVAGIVGLARALELAVTEREAYTRRVGELRDRLEIGALAEIPGTRVNGAGPRLPNLTSLAFGGLEGEQLAMRLDLEGVALSTGSACTSGAIEPSHVLWAMGCSVERSRGSLRFSLGRTTTLAQIDHLLHILPRAAAQVRGFSAPAS